MLRSGCCSWLSWVHRQIQYGLSLWPQPCREIAYAMHGEGVCLAWEAATLVLCLELFMSCCCEAGCLVTTLPLCSTESRDCHPRATYHSIFGDTTVIACSFGEGSKFPCSSTPFVDKGAEAAAALFRILLFQRRPRREVRGKRIYVAGLEGLEVSGEGWKSEGYISDPNNFDVFIFRQTIAIAFLQ